MVSFGFKLTRAADPVLTSYSLELSNFVVVSFFGVVIRDVVFIWTAVFATSSKEN